MEQKKLDRINELARKSKTVGLSEEEKTEQTALRNEYRKSVINNLQSQLNTCTIIDKNGNKKKVTPKD
ncbi:MAG: DUF896 domain-containing protein [Ruminococcus sp.]|nr:DUF896 domain-containing protein [Ruminococcus sp.]MCD7800584.1 DUF896 domain-containing protein [Ruminococcus sp.]